MTRDFVKAAILVKAASSRSNSGCRLAFKVASSMTHSVLYDPNGLTLYEMVRSYVDQPNREKSDGMFGFVVNVCTDSVAS